MIGFASGLQYELLCNFKSLYFGQQLFGCPRSKMVPDWLENGIQSLGECWFDFIRIDFTTEAATRRILGMW
jgi:hypothetical protein